MRTTRGDDRGSLRIDSEGMSEPSNEVVSYTRLDTGHGDAPTAEVERLGRAFQHAGLVLTLEDAWFDRPAREALSAA